METNVLMIADKLVNGERNEDYGHPAVDFRKVAIMWEVILGCPVSAEQVGLCMIGVKLSREVHKHGVDNLVDIAGYAQTVEMIHEYTENNLRPPGDG